MAFRSLFIVLWKNTLLRKRHWFLTICEIFVPVSLFFLIAYGRSKINTLGKVHVETATYIEPKSVDLIYAQYFNVETNIYYTPENEFTSKLIREVQLKLNLYSEGIKSFASEDELMQYYFKHGKNLTTMAVIFNGVVSNVIPKNLSYSIRPYEKGIEWKTDRLFYQTTQYMPEIGSETYFYKGLAALHIAIDSKFIEMVSEKSIPEIMVQEFPYPPHFNDMGITDLFMYVLPLITIFSFVLLCPAVLKRIVEEKTSGIKELMKMVGLQSWMLWLGWFIHALFVNLISIFFIVFFMKVSLWGAPYPPIEYCNFLVYTVLLLLYCAASITFCFVISTLFDRPTIAMIFGIITWILSYFIPATLLTSYENMRWIFKIILCIFPNVALVFGYDAISVYEIREIGVNWDNLFKSGSGGVDDISMGNVFLALIVDMIIFMIITLYIDNIKPGPYGLAKPWHYPFSELKSKFLPSSVHVVNESSEEVPLDPKPGIEIKNVSKIYGNHAAVNDISINIRDGIITVLLGHNGAGKSTTMMMITGMIEATCGTIKINDKDIRKNKNEIQRTLGLCPQHNLLFTDLTVLEHLLFFARLKGSSLSEARAEAVVLLKKFGIIEKMNSFPSDLSGGMKRKLCLTMALIGRSKVLVLDEPTSGMDPESRREVWNLLLEYRRNRTVLITTHFMEEADVLGDNVIIMDHGKVVCEGSPLTLKDKYGTGYHLSIFFERTYDDKFVDDITTHIKGIISEAKFKSRDGCNLTYILPIENKQSFPKLLATLELKKKDLGITNISMSITTMEDVFLRAGSVKEESSMYSRTDSNCSVDSCSKKLVGQDLFCNVIRALCKKRWYVFKKKLNLHFVQLFICIAIVFLTLYLGQGASDYYVNAEPGIRVELKLYGKTSAFYSCDRNLTKMGDYYKMLVERQNSVPEIVDQVSETIIKKGINNIAYYKQHMIVAAEFNKTHEGAIVNALYSNGALHGAAISIDLVMNSILKSLKGDDYAISTEILPLQMINPSVSQKQQSEVEVGLLWLVIFPLGLLFLVGGFIVFPQMESASNVIKLEFMCGIKPYIYWITNFVLDYVAYMLIILVVLFVITVYSWLGLETFGGKKELAALFWILMVYGLSAIPYSYLFSFAKSAANSFAVLLISGMFIGVTLTVVVMVLEMSGDAYYEKCGNDIKYFGLLFPQFGLTYISVQFARKAVQNHNWDVMSKEKRYAECHYNYASNPCCNTGDSSKCEEYRSYPLHLDEFAVIIGSAVVYFLILCFIESRLIARFRECCKNKWTSISKCFKTCVKNTTNALDETECDDGQNGDSDKESLLVAKKLKKQFGLGGNIVVNGVSFNVKPGECFGLLGVNGAGKTTTFKMLTGDERVTNGKAVISNGKQTFDITTETDRYLEMLGYCPQFDAINGVLTGRQTLEIFSLIRGVDKNQIPQDVSLLIHSLDLVEVADKPCGKYSGGNKRKLSIGIALVGSPLLVLLDEPTSGVDPVGRRKLWNIITQLKNSSKEKKSFVLTSHSMEECEALCNRLAIMKKGEIKCEDTIPKLKEKFGMGFTVKLKLKTDNNDDELREVCVTSSSDEVDGRSSSLPKKIRNLNNAIVNCYGEYSILRDRHAGLLHYHINNPSVTLSDLFTKIEQLKNEHPIIEDYSVSEPTLEDVFLYVANLNEK